MLVCWCLHTAFLSLSHANKHTHTHIENTWECWRAVNRNRRRKKLLKKRSHIMQKLTTYSFLSICVSSPSANSPGMRKSPPLTSSASSPSFLESVLKTKPAHCDVTKGTATSLRCSLQCQVSAEHYCHIKWSQRTRIKCCVCLLWLLHILNKQKNLKLSRVCLKSLINILPLNCWSKKTVLLCSIDKHYSIFEACAVLSENSGKSLSDLTKAARLLWTKTPDDVQKQSNHQRMLIKS